MSDLVGNPEERFSHKEAPLIFSVAACPVAKRRKLEETSTAPSAQKDNKTQSQVGSRSKRGKNKEGTVSENGKTPKLIDENKYSEMVELNIEKVPVVKKEEGTSLSNDTSVSTVAEMGENVEQITVDIVKDEEGISSNDKSVPAVAKMGESVEQITVDIKTEKSDNVLPTEIKTEPQEVDCFKEAEQAIRRLSSAGNDENVTYSVEMVNAGIETLYVKHEVEDIVMTENGETEVKKDETVTEQPSIEIRVAEDTGDIFSQIEAQCAEIQKNEFERTEHNHGNIEQEQNTSNLSEKVERVSPDTVRNVIDHSCERNDIERRSESPKPTEVKSVIHNVQAKDAVVRLKSSEQVMQDALSVVVADMEKSDDDGDDDDGEEDSDYMVLAEWTDGKEDETLPPGEKENMKQDKGTKKTALFS